MAMPKALVCILDSTTAAAAADTIEAAFRSSGFATAVISWKELTSQQSGLAELVEIVNDPALQAWAMVGAAVDFTEQIRAQVSLVSLSLTRETLPNTAFIPTTADEVAPASDSMPHITVYKYGTPVAPKMMAGRFKPGKTLTSPFYLKAHLDPFVGSWIEVGPEGQDTWSGFMLGLMHCTEGEPIHITAFGVGPRGTLPQKSTLEFPIQGIQGSLGEYSFTACAAKNTLNSNDSVYVKFEQTASGVLFSAYPEENATDLEGIRFHFV